MKRILYILILVPSLLFGQSDFNKKFKKAIKFATFYGAINGNNSIADVDIYSVNTGQLQSNTVKTPFDYSVVLGVRKIARFGYENR